MGEDISLDLRCKATLTHETLTSAPKRNEHQIAEDRRYMARQLVRGKRFMEIVRELNSQRPEAMQMSRQAYWADYEAVKKEWRDDQAGAMEEHMANQLAVLDEVECQAWGQWERSKEDKERVVTKEGSSSLTGPKNETATTVEGRLGDPNYLNVILSAREKRAKLLGLDAPIKQEHSGEVAISAMSEEQSTAFNAYLKAIEDKVKARTEKQTNEDHPTATA